MHLIDCDCVEKRLPVPSNLPQSMISLRLSVRQVVIDNRYGQIIVGERVSVICEHGGGILAHPVSVVKTLGA